jgi:hypothetical protein
MNAEMKTIKFIGFFQNEYGKLLNYVHRLIDDAAGCIKKIIILYLIWKKRNSIHIYTMQLIPLMKKKRKMINQIPLARRKALLPLGAGPFFTQTRS